MSNELKADYIPGGALDHYVKNATGQHWYPVGQAFEAWGGGVGRDATDYGVAMSGDDSGAFVGDFDSNTPAGRYSVVAKIRAGDDQAADDFPFGNREIWWNGTSEQTQTKFELNAYAPATETSLSTHDGKLDTVNTNVDTILSRIGAFTGSGVNTILGFFKALLNKTAPTPSDVGGTFDASTDAVEALSDQLDIVCTLGTGAETFPYTLISTVSPNPPISDADVWVTTDVEGTNVVASGRTDQNGTVTFYLDVGTVYFWRQKSRWNFDNPDTEVVS